MILNPVTACLNGFVEEGKMDWQPIATAPKDGSWFLAFYAKTDASRFQDQWKVAHWVEDWFHEGYPGIMDACEHEEFDQPTHWMPLPPVPATINKDSSDV